MMIEYGFYFLSFVMAAIPLIWIRRSEAIQQKTKKDISLVYLVGLVVWLIYLNLISFSGVLENFGLPPRVPLLIVIPILVGIFFFLGAKGPRRLLKGSRKSFPVYVQSFRVFVELLIYGAFVNGVFPESVTFEGTNFDILVGLSAPAVGFLHEKKKISDKGLVIWNVLALIVLTVTVASFVSAFYFSDWSATEGALQFVGFPYLLLASVLLPFAVFYHVVSLKQLIAARKTQDLPNL